MLPPVDSGILAANPGFDALYRELCGNKLNEDATSKLDARQQKEREAFSEELRKARVLATKKTLIKSHLSSLACRHGEFPEDTRELATVMVAVMSTTITDEEADLLDDDYQKLKSNLIPLSRAISKSISEDLSYLAEIASLGDDTASDGDVLQLVDDFKIRLATNRSRIAANRLDLVQEAIEVHSMYRKVMDSSIRLLEQTIHGAVSRGTKAKADYLATIAEGMSKKLQLQQNQLLSLANSPDMQEALDAKTTQLDREGLLLKRRSREAEERLAEYRQSTAIKSMAEEYAEIMSETEKVQEDIARLESAGRS